MGVAWDVVGVHGLKWAWAWEPLGSSQDRGAGMRDIWQATKVRCHSCSACQIILCTGASSCAVLSRVSLLSGLCLSARLVPEPLCTCRSAAAGCPSRCRVHLNCTMMSQGCAAHRCPRAALLFPPSTGPSVSCVPAACSLPNSATPKLFNAPDLVLSCAQAGMVVLHVWSDTQVWEEMRAGAERNKRAAAEVWHRVNLRSCSACVCVMRAMYLTCL